MLEEIFKKTTLKEAFFILIASFAIVNFWRATWGLMDLYLFPENYKMSLFISMFVSLFILSIITIYTGSKNKK